MVRALWIAVVVLGAATLAALLFAAIASATPCDPNDPPPGVVPAMRTMTAQSTACTHLTMRAGSLRMGALVLGASAIALAVAPFLPRRLRAAPIGLVIALSAFPAFMLFLFRAWDTDCGPLASYAGDCTHPVWILAPALLVGAASCVLIWREARAGR